MNQTINISLSVDELIYEIQLKTYLRGKTIRTDETYKNVHNLELDEDNDDIIKRELQDGYNFVKNLLSEYLVSSSTSSNNSVNVGGTLALSFVMPSNYNNAVNDTLTTAIHQYLVNYSIGGWYSLTNKEEATEYLNLAVGNIDVIKDAIYKRKRPTKTHL